MSKVEEKIGDSYLDADVDGSPLLSKDFFNSVENGADLISYIFCEFQQSLSSDQCKGINKWRY